MALPERLKIPLLAPLIRDGIKPGTNLVVEYDPQSQWLAVARTIAAGWVKAGFQTLYVASVQSREEAINSLAMLSVDVSASEKANLLRVDDYYSATLSLEHRTGVDPEVIDGKYIQIRSFKVADLSVDWLRQMKGTSEVRSRLPKGTLAIVESFSMFLRFNEEKAFLDWMENRNLPLQRHMQRSNLLGFVRGLHSESFYKRLENAYDGVIDVRVMERGDEAKSFLRLQSLKGQPHDSRWHEIEIRQNGEAVIMS